MKKVIFILLILLMAVSSNSQTIGIASRLNLDFEKVENGFPVSWNIFGAANYSIQLDSNSVISGKYSALIEFKAGNVDFKALGFTLPNNYDGKVITLSGYIKTENVKEGYAGLWMRIDPSIAFDNMNNYKITGTRDWQKCSISLNMIPDKTTKIVIGGMLQGKGKMWLDNLQVKIDGRDIIDLNPYIKKVFPAEIDKDFDNGSGISNITLNKNNIDNLRILGLVWGYIKYYHPNVSTGNFNMDYELFRVLPAILKVKSRNERNNILSKWIDHFGSFDTKNEPATFPYDIKILPDLEWIGKSVFSEELCNKLLSIEKAYRSNKNYYVEMSPKGNPVFNEKSYDSFKLPDAGFRLLSLYRYWNIIQYFHPSKYLIGEDWKNILKEFIPKFTNADSEMKYSLTCLELIGRIHDTHANIWGWNKSINDYLGSRSLPVKLVFIDNKAVISGFFNNQSRKVTGLELGDIVVKVNNKHVQSIVKERLKYTPASNLSTQLRDIANNLLRTNDSTLCVKIIRNGETENKLLRTELINADSSYLMKDTCFKIVGNNIVYLNMRTFQSKYLSGIWEKAKKSKGMIIDIRNYPSDIRAYFELSKLIMPKETPFVKISFCSVEFPGRFYMSPSGMIGQANNNYFKGKIVVIVNEMTQSNAEFQAMIYRVAPNTIVIGSTTAGADGDVSSFTLPGGISTMISGIGIYWPDGRETQRIGIIPDIEVKPTIESIKERRDELLERAISIIMNIEHH